MKLRLYALNIILPLSTLALMGLFRDASFLLPEYVAIGLLAFTLGRSYLLLQQQTFFVILPFLLFIVPADWGWGLEIHAPFVLPVVTAFLCWVNFQRGQRPWRHPLYLVNWLWLGLIAALGLRAVPVPDEWLVWNQPLPWQAQLAFVLAPGLFAWQWVRLGRFAAYWPLLATLAFHIDWAEQETVFLWMALASLFSLTLDSYVMAFVDELTGIPGRRAMVFRLKTLSPYYFIAMLDVDHFKKFNDNHGHQVGDDVLRTVARLLSKAKGAKAYRYGGEEFALIFSHGAQEAIKSELDRIRESIAQYDLYPKERHRKKHDRGKGSARKPLHVTVSFGLAQHHPGQQYEAVIEHADKALYRAKKNGRNRVEVAK